MKRKIICILLTLMLGITLSSCGGSKYEVPQDMQDMYDAFIENADQQFAYDIALELSENPDFLSSPLGGRNSGSAAEHAAADWLAGQMKDLGLEDVTKDGAKCDVWENKGSSVQLKGDSKVIDVYSYATAATPKAGINAEIVFVGMGSMYDYEDQNVKGKIVLVDIDQREEWWVTYPMLEAQYQGAAAIMSANVRGFGQVNKEALNAQDVCAPTGIPCVSISVSDSNYIKSKLEEGKVTANLKVDNVVKTGKKGTTYNITGKIKGKSSENQIIVGAHYDTHFDGFQDDNCAVGLALAMAKAMKDSGYIPENDIIFCLHGAEEWGASGTQYDWCVGSWEMINNIHPEWQGKTLAFINFELPAFEFDSYTYTGSAPEMFKMIDFYTNTWPLSPKPKDCFKDGIKTEGYQNYTYSDDFSYYEAGVPSTINGFLLTEDGEDVFDFYYDYYHSQFDNKDTYNEAVMDFNLKYYGALAMYVDQTPALYLDYSAQYDRMLAAINEDIMTAAGADVEGYKAALEGIKDKSAAMTEKIEKINDDYIKAKIDEDQDAANALWAEGKELTKKNLETFGFVQKHFLDLMYEQPLVSHEAPQTNIEQINDTVGYLKDGDMEKAYGSALLINNFMEYYAMNFSPAVIKIQDDMFWGKKNQKNLYWGTGRNFVPANVQAASRGIAEKFEVKDPDMSKEIAIYEKAVKAQEKVLAKHVAAEIKALNELSKKLEL